MSTSPPTLLAILRSSTEFLLKHGVTEARLDAEHLLAHGLGLKRMDIYLQFDRPLTEAELAKLRPLIQRRSRREPLQHILGTTAFRHLEIACDGRALIPRPETEMLVEYALEVACQGEATGNEVDPAPQQAASDALQRRMLEIGVGTGAPVLAFAQEAPQRSSKTWECWGCDISPAALDLARQNAASNGLADAVHWQLSDLTGGLPPELRFDLVLSNPPYIPSAVLPTLEPEVRDHDPRLALDGGADGLELVRRLLRELPARLNPGAWLLLELGYDQRESFAAAVAESPVGWILSEWRLDLEGVARFPILSWSPTLK